MRSRSRERSLYVSDGRGRDRENSRSYRSRDRDHRYGDSSKGSRNINRSDSRSRSRDRIKSRERMNDASRELREVKRILSNPTGDSKLERDRRDDERGRSDSLKEGKEKDNRERSRNDGAIQPNTTGRKSSYDDYNRHGSSRNDDDARNDLKRVRREGSFHDDGAGKDKSKALDSTPSKTESVKEGKENHHKTGEPTSAEKAYDEKELAEIEQFLAKTASKAVSGTVKAENEPLTPGKVAATLNNDKKETKNELKDIKQTINEKEEEEEDVEVEVDLLWEDEETIARREAQEAEERRKKRLEIASKYNNNNSTNGTANTVAGASDSSATGSDKEERRGSGEGSAAAAVEVVLMSPTKLPASAFDGTKGLPSPKAVVPILDLNDNTTHPTSTTAIVSCGSTDNTNTTINSNANSSANYNTNSAIAAPPP